MPENPDWERHWNTICLGIVTLATGAVGGALFATDFTTTTGLSLIEYTLTVLAITLYLVVLARGSDAVFSSYQDLIQRGTSKRDKARELYWWFFLELFTLAGLLVADAFSVFLQGIPSAQ